MRQSDVSRAFLLLLLHQGLMIFLERTDSRENFDVGFDKQWNWSKHLFCNLHDLHSAFTLYYLILFGQMMFWNITGKILKEKQAFWFSCGCWACYLFLNNLWSAKNIIREHFDKFWMMIFIFNICFCDFWTSFFIGIDYNPSTWSKVTSQIIGLAIFC